MNEVDGVVDEEVIAEGLSKMTGVSAHATREGREPNACSSWKTSCTRRSSASTRRSCVSQGVRAGAVGPQRPQPADGLVHLRRPVRRG